MSSAAIWVLAPGIAGGVLFLLRRNEKTVIAAATGIAALLALLAWFLSIGEALPFLPSITIQDTLVVLGRKFVLSDADRPYLLLIYLVVAMWLGGSWAARSGSTLAPIGLVISSLLTAALAVEPPLYAAMLIELAALVSIPVLAPPGKPASRGVLRFLTFQTLGMPFILSTGWFLPVVVSDPLSKPIITAIVLLLLGFALISAIFPFHTWLISLASEINPYPAAFIYFILLSNIAFFGVNFIDHLEWLHNFGLLYSIMRIMGSLMIFSGGLWAAFQRHLGRIMGYGILVIIGSSLLAISLGGPISDSSTLASTPSSTTTNLFLAIILPNGLALAIWALALSIIRSNTENLTFRKVRGVAFQMPIASTGMLAAHFSLASLPLLAGFPLYLTLFSKISTISFPTAIFAMLGIGGLMFAALRTMAVLFSNSDENPTWSITENRTQVFLLLAGVCLLLRFGLVPHMLLPLFAALP